MSKQQENLSKANFDTNNSCLLTLIRFYLLHSELYLPCLLLSLFLTSSLSSQKKHFYTAFDFWHFSIFCYHIMTLHEPQATASLIRSECDTIKNIMWFLKILDYFSKFFIKSKICQKKIHMPMQAWNVGLQTWEFLQKFWKTNPVVKIRRGHKFPSEN